MIYFLPKGDRTVASSRYRVYHVVDALKAAGTPALALAPSMARTGAVRRVAQLARDSGRFLVRRPRVLVLQRPGRGREELLLARLARRLGAAVVLDMDDPLDLSASSHTARALELSDRVLVGDRSLLADLPPSDRRRAEIVPTPLPVWQYGPPDRGACGPGPGQPQVVVGWVGDGLSQRAEVHRLVEDFATFALGEVTLRIIGSDPADALGNDRVDVIAATGVDWGDERAIAELFGGLDIGLAPYRGRGGVAFKVVQYLAAGSVPLVDHRSPGRAHLRKLPQWLSALCVTDFEDPGAWGTALRALTELVCARRREVTELCRAAASDYDVAHFARTLCCG